MGFGLNRRGIRGQKIEHKAMALEEEDDAKDNETEGMASAFVSYTLVVDCGRNSHISRRKLTIFNFHFSFLYGLE